AQVAAPTPQPACPGTVETALQAGGEEGREEEQGRDPGSPAHRPVPAFSAKAQPSQTDCDGNGLQRCDAQNQSFSPKFHSKNLVMRPAGPQGKPIRALARAYPLVW